MQFEPTEIAGAYKVRLDVHADQRGSFRRTWCGREFAEAGLAAEWVQMNHSVTIGIGSARGLHFQCPPRAEDKLVACSHGRAFDVAVDLRRGSPTFLRWTAVKLDRTTSFYIPKGCAHGFQTLEEEVHLLYLHSEYYAPEAEAGLRIDDPALGIEWPLPFGILSDRDRSFPLLDTGFAGLTI